MPRMSVSILKGRRTESAAEEVQVSAYHRASLGYPAQEEKGDAAGDDVAEGKTSQEYQPNRSGQMMAREEQSVPGIEVVEKASRSVLKAVGRNLVLDDRGRLEDDPLASPAQR